MKIWNKFEKTCFISILLCFAGCEFDTPPLPEEILISEQFSSGFAEDWHLEGSWYIDNGKLIQPNTEGQFVAAIFNDDLQFVEDFDFQATVHLSKYSETMEHYWDGFSLFFYIEDIGVSSWEWNYFFLAGNKFSDDPSWAPDGYFSFDAFLNGDYHHFWDQPGYAYPFNTSENQTFDIKIEIRGNSMVSFVNGLRCAQVTKGSIPQPKFHGIGLQTRYTSCWFDDIVLRAVETSMSSRASKILSEEPITGPGEAREIHTSNDSIRGIVE